MGVDLHNHCIDFSSDLQSDGSVLAVSNCAGGGHIEAAKAIRAQFLEQQKTFDLEKKLLKGQFKTVDIFQGSFPPLINRLFAFSMIYHWNKAKRSGNIQAQERLYNGKIMGVAKSILVDWILFIPVFISIFFRLIFNRSVTHIVITQPLGISAIIKAARLINYLFSRKIHISTVLTDLPTEGAIHYSKPIKNLSNNDKSILKVITTKPLILEKGESEKAWWNRVFGLKHLPDDQTNSQVLYREFPLRPALLKWKDVPASHSPKILKVKVNNSEEEKYINKLLRTSTDKHLLPKKEKKVILIKIDPQKEFMGLVTIGSQAAKKSKDYVIDFISLAKTLPKDRQYSLFVACGKHKAGENTLFQEVYDICSKTNLPPHIRIIPMGFQDDEELAPILHRMNFGIESTGGLTCFEFNRTAKSKIFLHSESDITQKNVQKFSTKGLELSDQQSKLLQGFSLWEKWNAIYQIFDKNAEIITPGSTFIKSLIKIINQ